MPPSNHGGGTDISEPPDPKARGQLRSRRGSIPAAAGSSCPHPGDAGRREVPADWGPVRRTWLWALSSWFSRWHCRRACRSASSAWARWAFSRHFCEYCSERTSSSRCTDCSSSLGRGHCSLLCPRPRAQASKKLQSPLREASRMPRPTQQSNREQSPAPCGLEWPCSSAAPSLCSYQQSKSPHGRHSSPRVRRGLTHAPQNTLCQREVRPGTASSTVPTRSTFRKPKPRDVVLGHPGLEKGWYCGTNTPSSRGELLPAACPPTCSLTALHGSPGEERP